MIVFKLPGTRVLFFISMELNSRRITAYFVLPETEHRTLEKIELFFSDKSRKLTDIRVRKITDHKKPNSENTESVGRNRSSIARVSDIIRSPTHRSDGGQAF